MGNKPKYVPPKLYEDAFTCPYCEAYAQQEWWDSPYDDLSWSIVGNRCNYCEKSCLWIDEKMIIPDVSGLPMPNEDMDEDIKGLYEEARAITNKSPRAAAALIRVALEKILRNQLNLKGRDIYTMIKKLIEEQKLPSYIEKALQFIKNTGNDACHSGKINFNDNLELVSVLFILINEIAEELITKPRERQERMEKFQKFPENTMSQNTDLS